MKAAIYCRVSTDEQTTDNQELILVEHAKLKGFEYEVYTETESSGNTRPVKAKLLKLLRAKRYSTLLIYKMDRWARSSTELLLEFQELHDMGINIISLSDNLDLNSASGRLQFQILAAFAEFEKALIKERTKAGLNRARLQGKVLGRPRKTPLPPL